MTNGKVVDSSSDSNKEKSHKKLGGTMEMLIQTHPMKYKQ